MKTKKIYMVYSIFMMLAGLLLFTVQGVRADDLPAGKYRTAAETLAALTASGSTAVIFDVRTVDEHNGCQPPWLGTACPDTTPPKGTPAWVVDGVVKLPINIPFWNTTNWPNGNTGETNRRTPEDPTEVKAIIENLLAAGVIDFDTEIHLLCRSAVRSHLMLHWIEDQGSTGFYNARTDTNGNFTNLYDIDSDGIEGSTQGTTSTYGGMKLWNEVEVGPLYTDYSGGVDNVPPQIFSKTPAADATPSSGDITFTVSVLEPTAANFLYPAVTDVSLYLDSSSVGSDSNGTSAVWTDFTFSQTGLTGTHTWNASATNSAGTSWNPNAMDDTVSGPAGPGERSFTITLAADINVTPPTTSNDPYDFGNIQVGVSTPPTVIITVTNSGGADLTLGTLGTLSAPFSIESQTCFSDQTIVSGDSCTITVAFSPTTTGAASEDPVTLSIPSNDTDETVYLKGAGVNLPTETPSSDAPVLVSPADGGTTPSSLTFEWKPFTGAESYKLFYCQEPDFSGTGSGCSGVDITDDITTDDVASLKNKNVYYYAGTGFSLLLFGVVLTGGIRERRKIMLLLAAVVISSGMLFVSCGDGDNNSTVSTDDKEHSSYKTYAVSGLSPDVYYWGVVAVDADGNQIPSVKWEFTVK